MKKKQTRAINSIVSKLKVATKNSEAQLKKFLETAPECNAAMFHEQLQKCWKKNLLPVLKSMRRDNTLFEHDDEGGYVVVGLAADNLEKIEACMRRRMTVCAIDEDHPEIDYLDTTLENMVQEYVEDANNERNNDGNWAKAVEWAPSIVDYKLPSIQLVRERLGDIEAEQYRRDLEALENSEIEEFQIEPDFLVGKRMNEQTILKKMYGIALLATGDKFDIVRRYENHKHQQRQQRRR